MTRQISEIATEREDGGPVDADWMHGLQVWVGVDKDRDAARERLADRMQSMYHTPYERFERYSPFGSPEEIADALAPYVESGCRTFNIMPVAASTEAAIEGVSEIAERLRRIA